MKDGEKEKDVMRQVKATYLDAIKRRVNVIKQELQSLQTIMEGLKQLCDKHSYSELPEFQELCKLRMQALQTSLNMVDETTKLLEVEVRTFERECEW